MAGENSKIIQEARKTKSDKKFEEFLQTNFMSPNYK
jgi:hypothetical protein